MSTQTGKYTLNEFPIYTGLYAVVFSGISHADKKNVVIKILRNKHPTLEAITRFKHEFEIAKIFSSEEDIVHVEAFEKYDTTYAIVMENLNASTLADILDKEKKIGLKKFLDIAIQITIALGHIHQKKIIHKDINPSNIMYDLSKNKITIIDFGLSADLPKERAEIVSPNILEGSLAYISPEQTGRMNRGIDYRTDYYSLGVTFYELLTGILPYTTKDPMELVHFHIAGNPKTPHEVDPAIPKMISAIIMKLMSKKSEDRYQNTNGLLADLKKCQDMLRESGSIQDFVLGTYDIFSRFQIPEKLYGREQEVEKLLKAYDQILEGKVELMLVTGYSGIGKSALVHEIHKPIAARQGHFIQGKFDQYKHNIPYAALAQAFEEFIKQLLSESEERIAHFHDKILAAVGENGKIIVDVIPNLSLIIGEQPPVTELGAAESRNRFSYVFQNFITALCAPEHPLVMFLDDLQWADLSSLRLLETLVSDSSSKYLLIIGAYRSNEVNAMHPLMISLGEIKKRGLTIETIDLGPLTPDNIAEILADTLHQDINTVQALAKMCYEKTAGNPFFLLQLLSLLYKEQLIEFQANDNKWTWHLSRIQEKSISENVVELMIGKLRELTPSAQRALQLAACIGSQFNLDILSSICKKEPESLLIDLQEALKEGYIFAHGESYRATAYQFGHDRIQQAAHSLIDENEKKRIHMELARLLLSQTPPDKLDEIIFTVVDHYNTGIETSFPPDLSAAEKKSITILNLRAAKAAKSAAAFEPAFRYIENALKCVDDSYWKNNYALMLELYTEGAETAYLSGQYELTDKFAKTGIEHAHTIFDELKIIQTQVYSNVTQLKQRAAIDIVLKTLKRLGIGLPSKANNLHILAAIAKTKWLLAGKNIPDLLNLPEMTDPTKKAVVHLISTIYSSAYEANPNLFVIFVCTAICLSLRYGNTKGSAFSYSTYGLISCGVLGEIDKGYLFGQLGLNLVDKTHDRDASSKVTFVNHCFVRHWKERLLDYLPQLVTNFDFGLDNGDLEISGLSISIYFFDSWLLGIPLKELLENIDKYKPFLTKNQQITANNYLSTVKQACLNMINTCDDPGLFKGAEFNEAELIPQLEVAHDKSGLFMLYSNKLILIYLFEKYAEAREAIKRCDEFAEAMVSSFQSTTFFFYRSLTLLALYSLSQDKTEKRKFAKEIRASQKKYAIWAKKSPANYSQRYALVEAEYKWRVKGDTQAAAKLFDQAIELARVNEFLNEQALANELAAKFFLAHENKKVARLYMQDAHQCYRIWGADAKVAYLEERYSNLVLTDTSGNFGNTVEVSISATTTGTSISETLDLSTFLKSSQIISNNIILEDLLKKLMRVVIENAGAQKSYLLLNKNGRFLIEAEGSIDHEEGRLLSSKEMTADILPLNIINYVIRTKEPVVLDNASRSQQYANDSYIISKHPKSILCFPLLNQGTLTGILYLENDGIEGAFTKDRINILNLLSSQITMSIENARLFTNTKELNDQLIILNKSYERFVPENFLSLLNKKSILDVRLGDQTQSMMTVLFADIRNFTDRSEKMSPQENFIFINSVLSVMAPIIRKYHGFIDKYIGDAIMAIYPHGADDALQCAFEMQAKLVEYNNLHLDQETVKIGIGINSGMLMLGTVGVENRMNATVISDAVNIASRVEALSKTYDAPILITENTYKQLKNLLIYQIAEIGKVPMKGKSQDILIYKAIGINDSD